MLIKQLDGLGNNRADFCHPEDLYSQMKNVKRKRPKDHVHDPKQPHRLGNQSTGNYQQHSNRWTDTGCKQPQPS
ncbi:hypothetical protein AB3S75_018052 [Citrus x aurantiifolia]